MPNYDTPDWQKIVTVVSGGAVSDAPDWQRVVTGPGAAPVGGGTPFTWGPAAYGWTGWVGDPVALGAGTFPFGAGDIQLAPFYCATTATIGRLIMSVTASGSTVTANENFLGLYSAPGSGSIPGAPVLLGHTAAGAIDSQLTAGGFVNATISPTVSVTAGEILYMAFLFNYATGTGPLMSFYEVFGLQNPGPPIYPGFIYQSLIYAGPHTSLPSSLATPTNAINKGDSVLWGASI